MGISHTHTQRELPLTPLLLQGTGKFEPHEWTIKKKIILKDSKS